MTSPRTIGSPRTVASLSLVVWLAFVVAACADAPTAATRARPVTAFSLAIDRTHAEEKARVAATLEASKATYDSLKAIWEAREDGEDVDADRRFALCDPLQYVGTVKVIGPEGGDLDFGPHKLRVPAGAVSVPTVFTAEAVTSLRVEARFAPHGLTFSKPPVLTLSYKHCVGDATRHVKRIVYLAATGTTIAEWLDSDQDDDLGLVRAPLQHFSAYAVAY